MTVSVKKKKDRCTKGKSCGFTCISSLRRCLIDMRGNVQNNLGKLRNLLTSFGRKQPIESPKYSSTPGSRSPLPFDKVSDVINRGLKAVYQHQGFNARPELVPRTRDLLKRNDILRDGSGSPIIMYRGLTEKDFIEQFKGKGVNGGIHYAGNGMHGNGTYSEGAPANNNKLTERARKTAKNFSESSAWGDPPNKGLFSSLGDRIVAFGLRNDSNIVRHGGSPESREAKFKEWSNKIIEDSRKRFKDDRITDVGIAAAMMGIHAYEVPIEGGERSYWVILNRGAVIAADKL